MSKGSRMRAGFVRKVLRLWLRRSEGSEVDVFEL